MVQPTNISVLSHINIEIKIRHLMMILSAVPDIEITCTDSCECFDTNKSYIKDRIEEESNEKVRKILNKDLKFLDSIQTETSTARQFCSLQGANPQSRKMCCRKQTGLKNHCRPRL